MAKKMLTKVPKFYFLLLLIFLLLFFVHDKYYLDIIIISLIWAAAASAWNISGGFAGRFSLGHAGYLGIGAYTSTLLFLNYKLSPWLGMLIGGVAAAFVACVFGVLFLRLRGAFYTLATIAFGELVYISTTQLRGISHGSLGLQIPFQPGTSNFIFDGATPYAFLSFLLVVVMYVISSYIQKSKLGYLLIAMREDPDAARSLGVNTRLISLFSTSLSAFLTAVCGSFLVQYVLFIEPDNVLTLTISIQIAMFAIVGGMGDASGPIIGSLILTPIGMLLRDNVTQVSGLDVFIYGLILVLIVLYMPNGIIYGIEKLVNARERSKKWDLGRENNYGENVAEVE